MNQKRNLHQKLSLKQSLIKNKSIYSDDTLNSAYWLSGFKNTNTGFVPVVKTSLQLKDYLNYIIALFKISANIKAIPPGLYAAGNPDKNSTVIILDNNALNFSFSRSKLKKQNIWILVLDTYGLSMKKSKKKNFDIKSELTLRIKNSGLSNIVSHKTLTIHNFNSVFKDKKTYVSDFIIKAPQKKHPNIH